MILDQREVLATAESFVIVAWSPSIDIDEEDSDGEMSSAQASAGKV